MSMHDDIAETLVSEQEIQAKVAELGRRISEDYAGSEILLIGLLRGAIVFLSDLMRAISIPVRLDFIGISSYGASTESGAVRLVMDLETDIAGRHVLVVEDIVDTGKTLSYLLENLKARQPASLRICALLDKPERRTVPIAIDYVGFEIADKFVVGYGLDFAEGYRNLPFVGGPDPGGHGSPDEPLSESTDRPHRADRMGPGHPGRGSAVGRGRSVSARFAGRGWRAG
jgi:hypoxanthine phosphoribosyltransferase